MHSHNSAILTSFCLHLFYWVAKTQRIYLASHNCDILRLCKNLAFQELLWYNNHWLSTVFFTPSLYTVTNYLKIPITEAKFKNNPQNKTQTKNNERIVFSSSISSFKDSFIKLGHNYLRYLLQAWMGAISVWSHYMMNCRLIKFHPTSPFQIAITTASVQRFKKELKNLQERKERNEVVMSEIPLN